MASFALLFELFPLQNLVHTLLLAWGLTDLVIPPGWLKWWAIRWGGFQWRDIVILGIGIVAYLGVRKDRKTPDGAESRIRAFFLAGLSAVIGMRVILALIMIVRNWESYLQGNIAIAASLAAVIVWLLGLIVVMAEWSQWDDDGGVGEFVDAARGG